MTRIFSAPYIYSTYLFFNSYVFIENRYESKHGSVREQTWFDAYLSGRWLGAAMRTVWEGDPLRAFQGWALETSSKKGVFIWSRHVALEVFFRMPICQNSFLICVKKKKKIFFSKCQSQPQPCAPTVTNLVTVKWQDKKPKDLNKINEIKKKKISNSVTLFSTRSSRNSNKLFGSQ